MTSSSFTQAAISAPAPPSAARYTPPAFCRAAFTAPSRAPLPIITHWPSAMSRGE